MRVRNVVVPDEGNVRLRGLRTMVSVQTDERASAILARRAKGLLAHDEALAELADADCAAAIVATIAERLCIRANLVQRAVDTDDDKPVSVMCRAAGFNTDSYSALLRMRRRHSRGIGSAPALALTFFSALSRLSAERMLPRVAADLGRKG
jgi:23S rRNA C2498 (ribose-2'-O)-methylase RlmM